MRRLRRFWWRHVRRYDSEICGEVGPGGGPAAEVIREYGCGRPVGLVWAAPTWLWNLVTTGMTRGDWDPDDMEGAGGILCVGCFDRAARDRTDVPALRWEATRL